MRLILVTAIALGVAPVALTAAEEPEAGSAGSSSSAGRAGPDVRESLPTAEKAEASLPRRHRAKVKNIFLPLVPKPPATTDDRRETAPVINAVSPVPPPEDMQKPEDAMFITGIVCENDEMQVLVEDRRTGIPVYLKKGDALGEGVIVDIGTYHVTVKEWTVTRRIPLGYSVSGKPDGYVPPPVSVSMSPGSESGSQPADRTQGGSSASAARLPSWPGRKEWAQWSPQQRKDYLARRREAWRRLQERRPRRRR